MYISPQSAVYRVPVWHPDPPRVYAIPPAPAPPMLVEEGAPEPVITVAVLSEWVLTGPWARLKTVSYSLPQAFITISPPRFRSELYPTDALWPRRVARLLPQTPAEPLWPPPIRTFTLFQFPPEWQLVSPWLQLKRPPFTPDDTIPPTITPRTARADLRVPDWQLLQPWTARLSHDYTPDTPISITITPRTFRADHHIPAWELRQPWSTIRQDLTEEYPPRFGLDTITSRTFRADHHVPPWRLLSPWTSRLSHDYIPDASVPPLIQPSRSRAELYPTDRLWPRVPTYIKPESPFVEPTLEEIPTRTFAPWQLVSDYWMQVPVDPEHLTEPAPDTPFPVVPPVRFRADLYLREWWGEFTIPTFTPEAAPPAAPYIPGQDHFQLSQFPEAWTLSRPWMPRAYLPRDRSIPPSRTAQTARADLFVPDWVAQSPWTHVLYPSAPSLIPAPAISAMILLRKWRRPSVPVQVNWGHPLAQGLSVAILTVVPTAFLEDRGPKIRRFTQVGTMGTAATIGGLARDYGGSFQWDSLSDSTILPAGVAASFAYGFVPDTDVPPHRALWSIGNDAVDASPALDVHVGQVANRMSYYNGTTALFTTGTNQVIKGQFYHGLYTWTPTGALRQKIYLNGALDSAVDHASVGGNRPTLWLGTGWNQQFDGKLAYFYAWTGRALTQADAYTLMANPTAFWMTNSEWIFGGTPGVPTAGNLVPWHLFGMRAH